MANFCGKCGTALDNATGFCPNCDREKFNVVTNTSNFCSKCGSTIDKQTGLCPNCDNFGTDSYQESVPKTETLKEQKPKKSKAVTTLITVILSICLFLTSAFAITIYSVRNAVKEDNAEKLFENVNVLVLLENSNDLERFYTHMSSLHNIQLTDQKLERFIDKSTIKPYVAEKISDFAEDFFEDYAELKFSKREIANLLQRNSSVINDEFGVYLMDYEIESIAEWIIGEDEVVVINISDFKSDNSALYFVISIAISYITMAIFIVLSALIIFFMIRNNLSQAVCGISINLIVFGGLTSIISLLAALITPLWQTICGDSIIGMVIGNIISVNALLGIIFLILGVSALVIRKLVIKNRIQKQGEIL